MELVLCYLDVLDREDRFGFLDEFQLCGKILVLLGVDRVAVGLASIEEDLLCGAETGPQLVIFLAGDPACGLLLFEQVAVGGGG